MQASERNAKYALKAWRLGLFRGFAHDPRSGLCEVLALRFLLHRAWVAGLLFELIGLPLCSVGFCAFLCHVNSLRRSHLCSHACGFKQHHYRFLQSSRSKQRHVGSGFLSFLFRDTHSIFAGADPPASAVKT